mmetsp:Transcript_22051/g.63058  ORF Transcript_22051/g.63058 Transcript_22051/m.63058 type:complete len:207 (+) Transcript_22051:715-1335(+)
MASQLPESSATWNFIRETFRSSKGSCSIRRRLARSTLYVRSCTRLSMPSRELVEIHRCKSATSNFILSVSRRKATMARDALSPSSNGTSNSPERSRRISPCESCSLWPSVACWMPNMNSSAAANPPQMARAPSNELTSRMVGFAISGWDMSGNSSFATAEIRRPAEKFWVQACKRSGMRLQKAAPLPSNMRTAGASTTTLTPTSTP